MNQDLFDQIILNNLIAKLGTSAFGYIAANNGVYDTYYTNNEFQNFITEMKINYPVHYSAYAQGKGSELLPGSKNGTPPKMASVASSSRFCLNPFIVRVYCSPYCTVVVCISNSLSSILSA